VRRGLLCEPRRYLCVSVVKVFSFSGVFPAKSKRRMAAGIVVADRARRQFAQADRRSLSGAVAGSRHATILSARIGTSAADLHIGVSLRDRRLQAFQIAPRRFHLGQNASQKLRSRSHRQNRQQENTEQRNHPKSCFKFHHLARQSATGVPIEKGSGRTGLPVNRARFSPACAIQLR
jgi:hypothetical protein